MIVANFDGDCHPQTKVMTIGCVVVHEDGSEWTHSEIVTGTEGTKPTAELLALVTVVWYLKSKGIKEAQVRGNSQIAVYCTSGKWQCRKEHLRKLVDKAHRLAEGMNISYVWVPHHENLKADRLTHRR